jgi:hypothetical protein
MKRPAEQRRNVKNKSSCRYVCNCGKWKSEICVSHPSIRVGEGPKARSTSRWFSRVPIIKVAQRLVRDAGSGDRGRVTTVESKMSNRFA